MTHDFLLQEFDQEMDRTRRMLERVPDAPGFKPHPKSAALGSLANHVATLPALGKIVLTEPSLDVAGPNGRPPNLPFEGRDKLLAVFEGAAKELRQVLEHITDDQLQADWTLMAGPTKLMSEPRYLVYRQLFLNHLVHHRAQLGVYLRLNGVLLPMTYGPSADESPTFM